METRLSTDNFWECLRNANKIVIFGYTDTAIFLAQKIREHYSGGKMIAYCDNAASKQGLLPDGGHVYSVEQAIENFPDAVFILHSRFWWREQRQQLLSLNFAEANIISSLPEEIRTEWNDLLHQRQIKKLAAAEFRFEVNIVKHCNLNCKGCNHFSPLASNDFMSLAVYQKDIFRLAELFGHQAQRIFLLGGEPLLHPDIIGFLKSSREAFQETDISVVTNGILLPKMSTNFWEACRQYKIAIAVTQYPIALDYEAIRNIAASYNVDYRFFGGTETGSRTLWFEPLNLAGDSSIPKEFSQCTQANQCITLENGRLYTCILPPNISSFNRYFNKNLEVTDQDGIDIYHASSSEEILEFLCRPIPFCRYCAWEKHTWDHPWGVSQRDIREWS